jgi:hypothetical protein
MLARPTQSAVWLRDGGQESASFLKKSSEKLLSIRVPGAFTSTVQTSKSFLRAFFQKSAASFLRSAGIA